MEDRKKVDVVIPTYKPGKKFFKTFENAAAPDLACGEDHRDEYGEIILE